MSFGIYRIRNLETGKVYIGQTLNFAQRFKRHTTDLNCQVHSCSHLQRSYLKHGIGSFAFEIVETLTDKTKLTEREQSWIDHYKHLGLLYNTCLVAGSALGTRHSAEVREKISSSKRGKKHTPETIESMRAAHTGFKHTEESKLLIGKVSKAAQSSAEYRQMKSEIAKAKWRDPVFRANMLEKMQAGKQASIEGSISHSNKMKELWNNPEYKKRVTEAIKVRNSDPESRRRRSEAASLFWKKRRGEI